MKVGVWGRFFVKDAKGATINLLTHKDPQYSKAAIVVACNWAENPIAKNYLYF